MAPEDRQERQLMRQRGAGTRNIESVDFGFHFPTPGRTRRSASKTPQTARRDARRRSRTPSIRGRASSSTRSVREASRTSVAETTGNGAQAEGDGQSDQRSSKRRRIDGPGEGVSPLAAESTRRARIANLARPRRPTQHGFAIVDIEEEQEPERPPSEIGEPSNRTETTPSRGLPSGGAEDKENMGLDPAVGKSTARRKKRKSIGQQSGRRKKKSSSSFLRGSAIPSPTVLTPVGEGTPNGESAQDAEIPFEDAEEADEGHDGVGQFRPPAQDAEIQAEEEAHFDDEYVPNYMRPPATISTKKRKKRKSIVLGKKKRRVSTDSNPTFVQRPTRTNRQTSTVENDAESPASSGNSRSEEFALRDDLHDDESSSFQTSLERRSQRSQRLSDQDHAGLRRSIPVSSPAQRRVEPAEDEDDDLYVDEDASPEPPTPAPKRRSRAKAKTSYSDSQGSETTEQRTRKTVKSTFPILVHRMTNANALPTITEESESNAGDAQEGDLANLAATFSDRTSPNALDVLAQICRETIDTAIENLEQKKTTGVQMGKAEIKRQRAALQFFRDELDGLLFEMSAAVENRLTLETRLRKSKRDVAEMQGRWMAVRKEREEIALKCDEVRRQHWDNEEDRKKRWEINELAQRTELELERQESGEEDDEEKGLEFLLRSVAADVSSKSDTGGFLDRVKAFNEQLSSIAAMLEGH